MIASGWYAPSTGQPAMALTVSWSLGSRPLPEKVTMPSVVGTAAGLTGKVPVVVSKVSGMRKSLSLITKIVDGSRIARPSTLSPKSA